MKITRLKRLLPIEKNYKIKHLKRIICQKEPNFKEKFLNCKKRILFLDTPEYENIGDQALCLAAKEFVKKNMPQYEQFEVQEDELLSYIKWLKNNIKPNDIICLNGGGNMGNLYHSYEGVRRVIISEFLDNPIIVFPQTVDYEKSSYGKKELMRSVKIYSKHPNLTLCAREEKSYRLMQKYYQNARLILCPDIVLSLDINKLSNTSINKSCVGLCIRDDEESILSIDDREILKYHFPGAIKLTTMGVKNERIDETNREKIVFEKLSEFSQCKLVVTDRLHGMIFSFITNTPCIALPNSNGKVEGVCNWIKEKGSTVFVNNVSQIQVKDHYCDNSSLENEYIDLIKALNQPCFKRKGT